MQSTFIAIENYDCIMFIVQATDVCFLQIKFNFLSVRTHQLSQLFRLLVIFRTSGRKHMDLKLEDKVETHPVSM